MALITYPAKNTGDQMFATEANEIKTVVNANFAEVSDAIDDAVNDALNSGAVADALALKAPIASPTFTGSVGGITKAMVGLGNVDNTADTAKPVSTAQQTALDLKLSLTSIVDDETPSGTMNDINVTFTLANTPISGTVKLYWNGMRMKVGVGFTISTASITMATAPTSGDTLVADYRK